MRKSKYKDPKYVLVFNGAQVLIAIVRSLHSASEFSGANLQAISFCCTGRFHSTGGYYYRHVHPDIQIEINDLNNLKLQDYDMMCGVERKYHTVREMAKLKRESDEIRESIRTKMREQKKKSTQVKRIKNQQNTNSYETDD